MEKSLTRFWGLLFLCLWIAACGDSRPTPKILRVGFVPSEDAQRVMQNAQPIVEILRKQLGMEIQPFVATDYTGVVEALRVNKLDIAFLTPASYVLAKNEANVRVVLKSERKGVPYYYAAIIVRADSGIKSHRRFARQEFRVRRFALDHRQRHSATDVQRARHRSGARLQASLIFRRSRRHRAGGASTAKSTPARPTPTRRTATTRLGCAILKDPRGVQKIRAIAFSEPIPADNLVISAGLDDALAKKIEATFIELSRDPAGKKMLRELYQIDGFVPATDKDYDSVRRAFADAGIQIKEALQKKRP